MKTFLLIPMAAAVWTWQAAALAQTPAGTGNVLDANPSLTGGRSNTPVAQPFQPGGQYLITGEARFGRSFQGFVPYSSTNQFQAALGTGTFYNFTRDSVSLQDVTRSYVPPALQQPSFNYSPRTVFSAGQIGARDFAGGSSTTTVLNPFARPSYTAFQALPSASDRGTAYPGQTSSSAWPQPMPAGPASLTDQLRSRQQLLTQQDVWLRQGGLPAPNAALPAREGQTPGPNDPVGAQMLIKPVAPVEAGKLYRIGDDLKLKPITPQDGAIPPPLDKSRDNKAGIDDKGPTGKDPSPPDLEPGLTLQTGQDLYADLLRKANSTRRTTRAGEPSFQPRPADLTPPSKGEPPPGELAPAKGTGFQPPIQPARIDPAIGEPGKSPGRSDRQAGQPANGAAGATALRMPEQPVDLGVSYASFVSRRPSEANAAIARAETLLAQKKFYQAVEELGLAAQHDPDNPLIMARTSHAYLAAGEFYSAAMSLRQAIRTFPSISSVRTDLASALGPGGERLLDDRLGALQRTAQAGDDASMWMLLAYTQWVSGRLPQAQRTAEFLVNKGVADAEAVALAELIINSAAPATAPER